MAGYVAAKRSSSSSSSPYDRGVAVGNGSDKEYYNIGPTVDPPRTVSISHIAGLVEERYGICDSNRGGDVDFRALSEIMRQYAKARHLDRAGKYWVSITMKSIPGQWSIQRYTSASWRRWMISTSGMETTKTTIATTTTTTMMGVASSDVPAWPWRWMCRKRGRSIPGLGQRRKRKDK